MKYRLVKINDIDRIVNLHYLVRENHPIGIFSTLDKTFLKQYYKILINDTNSVIVCAENEEGQIQGFCSSTLNVEKQLYNLKKKKLLMGISAVPSIFKKPRVLLSLMSRFKSISNKDIQFISNKGARLEYWVWSKENKDSVSSLIMHEALLNTISALGVKQINFEVDTYNKNVLKFHIFNGAKELKRILLEDKRERVLMQYDFDNRISKVKLYKNKLI